MTSVSSQDELLALVRRALEEDLGSGDVTTDATVAPDARARATITQKAPGVIYGLEAAEAVFKQLDPAARCECLVEEGLWREHGGPVLAVEGLARALLTGERTALNFLDISPVSRRARRAPRARLREQALGCSIPARRPPGCARWRRPPSRPVVRRTIARVSTTRF